MRNCSYCGRDNGDDAEFCSGCGTRLEHATPAIPDKPPTEISETAKEGVCSHCGLENTPESEFCLGCGSRLTLKAAAITESPVERQDNGSPSSEPIKSDNPWTAKDAWKCLGIFVVFNLVIAQMYRTVGVLVPGFHHFSGTGAGHLVISSIHYAVQIVTVLYFAQTPTLESFLKAFGLTKPPCVYTSFAVAITLMIRLAGHWMITNGFAKGITNTSSWGFAHSVGFERILYLLPLLMAPFAEELYMRGFFYRAFRGSYSVLASTLLIVGITAVTHSDQYSQSWVAVVGISAVTILQCFLRERTGNLRDCIICHLVFNASGALFALRVH